GQPALVHLGRVAGRGGEPGRASGLHDPRGDDPGGARPCRHFRRPAAPVGGHRGLRGPGRGRGRRAAGGAGRRRRGRAQAGGRMSTAAGLRPRRTMAREAGARRLALLGTGTVGSAFVARYQVLRQRGLPLPPVAWVANSRTVLAVADDPRASLEAARAAPRGVAAPAWPEVEALCAGDVVVDATASDAVAA